MKVTFLNIAFRNLYLLREYFNKLQGGCTETSVGYYTRENTQ